MNNYLILLGSTSPIKRAAYDAAIRLANMNANVRQFDVKSYVPEQPYGEVEIYAGATNRALETFRAYRRMIQHGDIKAAEENTIVLSTAIENGLFPSLFRSNNSRLVDIMTMDRGCVVIFTPQLGNIIKVCSQGVTVPIELVIEAVETNNQDVTAGKLEAARTKGCDPTDPHKVWSNGETSRIALLIPAVLEALEQVKKQL